MATTDTTYAVPADLKARLGPIAATSTASDALLQSYLNAAATTVDAWTRGYRPGVDDSGNCYEAFSSVIETRVFDDDLTGICAIDDCLSVSAVVRAGTPVASTVYKLWPYNRLPAEAIYFRADLLFEPILVGGTWYEYPARGVGVGQISITGAWGYGPAATRPPVIREATLRLAAWAYGQDGVKPAEKLQALRDPTRPFYWEIAQLLAPYQRQQTRSGYFG